MAVSVANSVLRQLLFEVGPHFFAVEVRRIGEVIEPCPATPVPGAPAWILGLINVRGTLLTAVDLASLLEVESRRGDDAALIISVREERRIALLVDRVVRMLDWQGGLDVGSDLLDALGAGELVGGVGEFMNRPFFPLDIDAIFDRVLGEVGAPMVER